MISEFTNDQLKQVSAFLQEYMNRNRITSLTADECANLLSKNNLLPNNVGPKPGFNFRQMLRDGRDGYIDLVEGACQERPNTRWFIYSVAFPKNRNDI